MTSLNAAASPVLPLVYERSAGYWETVGRRFLRDKVAVGAALLVGSNQLFSKFFVLIRNGIA